MSMKVRVIYFFFLYNGVYIVTMLACEERKSMLELILGPMRSGKTTALLQRRRGRTLIINHVLDTRTGDSVRTHDGVVVAAVKCSRIDVPSGYDTVLIDEGQFFDSLDGVESVADNVVVAGLSGDYLRRPFGKLLDLIPKASKVTMLEAVCVCGKKAQFTKRVSGEVDLCSVNSTYISVCCECYEK